MILFLAKVRRKTISILIFKSVHRLNVTDFGQACRLSKAGWIAGISGNHSIFCFKILTANTIESLR